MWHVVCSEVCRMVRRRLRVCPATRVVCCVVRWPKGSRVRAIAASAPAVGRCGGAAYGVVCRCTGAAGVSLVAPLEGCVPGTGASRPIFGLRRSKGECSRSEVAYAGRLWVLGGRFGLVAGEFRASVRRNGSVGAAVQVLRRFPSTFLDRRFRRGSFPWDERASGKGLAVRG